MSKKRKPGHRNIKSAKNTTKVTGSRFAISNNEYKKQVGQYVGAKIR